MTTRVLSSDPLVLLLDGAPSVAAAETTVGVVTVGGSTVAALDASLAGKVEEAPIDGNIYGRQNGAWSAVVGPMPINTTDVTNVSTVPGATCTDALNAAYALAGAADAAAAAAQADATQALADAATAQGEVDSLEIVVAGKVGEAPIDGQAYARKDGGWVVAASGGGTTDDITNASGVAGATCSDALDTLDGSKIGDSPNDGSQYARRSAAWERTYEGTVTTYSGVAASGNVILTTFAPAVNSQPVFFVVDATLVSTIDRSQHGAFRFLGSYGRGSAGATATGVLQSADTIAGSQSINLQVAGPNVQVRISMGTATCDYHARITIWPFATFNS